MRNLSVYRTISCVMVMFLIVFLSGCGGKSTGPAANDKEKAGQTQGITKLKVGYNIGSLNRELILETAFAKGYFSKYGLEIEDKGYSVGGQIVQDLVGGNLDIGLVGISPSMAGIAQGADIVVVASQTKNDCPLVARKSIGNLKDLDGKKVGTPGQSSIQETMLIYLERKEGFKTTHVYGKAPDLVGYLEKGEIDAILAWEPVAAQAVEKLDAYYLLDTVIPGAETGEVTVSGKLLREHPEVVINFLKAMEETRQYFVGNTAERVKVAAAKTNLPESVIAEGVRRSNLFKDELTVNIESVRLVATEDIASGKLKGITREELDAFLAKAIDTKYLKEALGKQ